MSPRPALLRMTTLLRMITGRFATPALPKDTRRGDTGGNQPCIAPN